MDFVDKLNDSVEQDFYETPVGSVGGPSQQIESEFKKDDDFELKHAKSFENLRIEEKE